MEPALIKQSQEAALFVIRRRRESSRRKLYHRNLTDKSAWIAAFVSGVIVSEITKELLAVSGVCTDAKHIVFEKQCFHVYDRRRHEARAIIRGIPEALKNIRYYNARSKPAEHTFVGKLEQKYLLVGVKFVPSYRSSSGEDEAWITTAYFLNKKKLRTKLNKNRLRPVRAGLNKA